MRIPLPIAVLVALLVALTVWWARTKDMDFSQPRNNLPPLPAYVTQPVGAEAQTSALVASKVPASETPNPNVPSSDPDLPPVELGDLDVSPGLSEYSEFASKGPEYFIRLGTELETKGHLQRALLAWERVLDTTVPSEEQRKTAQEALVRLRPTLPPWNIDPAGDLPLLLQLGTTRKDTDELAKAAQSSAEFFRIASDHTVLVTPRITTSRDARAPENAPVAIYFTGKGENQSNLSSFSPPDNELEMMERLVLLHAFHLIRQVIASEGSLTPPGLIANPTEPRADFSRQLTRRHWKIFAESLLHEE